MECDFFGVHYFNSLAFEPFTVSIFVLVMNEHSSIDSSWLILVEITAFPKVLSDNFFSLVVDVEDWSRECFSLLEIERPEHACSAQTTLVNHKFLVFSEIELGLSDNFSLDVKNVVVLNDAKLLVLMLFSLVADTDEHEAVLGSFPQGVKCALDISEAIWNADLLFDCVGLVTDGLSLFIGPQIISSEVPLLVMSGLEPCDHRVMVGLLYDIFISPLTIFRVEHVEWFAVLLKWIVEIAKFESVIVVSSDFLNAKVSCIGETHNLRLVTFLVEKVMFRSLECMVFKIKNDYRLETVFLLRTFRVQVKFASSFQHNKL